METLKYQICGKTKREYSAEFLEKGRAGIKIYYENNKDEAIEKVKKHREENREKERERANTYYHNNKEEELEGGKKYRDRQKEKQYASRCVQREHP